MLRFVKIFSPLSTDDIKTKIIEIAQENKLDQEVIDDFCRMADAKCVVIRRNGNGKVYTSDTTFYPMPEILIDLLTTLCPPAVFSESERKFISGEVTAAFREKYGFNLDRLEMPPWSRFDEINPETDKEQTSSLVVVTLPQASGLRQSERSFKKNAPLNSEINEIRENILEAYRRIYVPAIIKAMDLDNCDIEVCSPSRASSGTINGNVLKIKLNEKLPLEMREQIYFMLSGRAIIVDAVYLYQIRVSWGIKYNTEGTVRSFRT